ncbi:hypothetical protein ACU61A_03130 [Pseudonocardia sichuanensis]|nr:hypothetical protein [Pseudonocardia kunmingensis]
MADEEHSHHLSRYLEDGTLTDEWPGDPDARTGLAITACRCGWLGPGRQLDRPFGEVQEWAYDEWDRLHFGPMVEPAAGKKLLSYLDPTGRVRFLLAGREARNEAELELLMEQGCWVHGSFREVSSVSPDRPSLIAPIGGPWEEHGVDGFAPTVELVIPEFATLRWHRSQIGDD